MRLEYLSLNLDLVSAFRLSIESIRFDGFCIVCMVAMQLIPRDPVQVSNEISQEQEERQLTQA